MGSLPLRRLVIGDRRFCCGMLGTDGLWDGVLAGGGGERMGEQIPKSSLKEHLMLAFFENDDSVSVD